MTEPQSLPVVLTVSADLAWLPTAEAARLLGYGERTFRESIATRPGFPRPLRIDGKGDPRWNARELHEWALAERARRPGRKRAA